MENHVAAVGGRHYGARMRWDHLFDDLAGQLEHELTAEEADLQKEEERLRLGRLGVRERIVALKRTRDHALMEVAVTLRTGARIRLEPMTVGRDWMAGDIDGRDDAQAVVPFDAIESITLRDEQITPSLTPEEPKPDLSSRLGLPFLLRDLCRRRVAVRIDTVSSSLTGTIDRVGRDHLDLAEHDLDTPRRREVVRGVRLVRLDQVVVLRL
ncbi:uncharacterized protein MalAC0309_2230 [Microcella alkaliphila]|uniref:Uncharacterized protein n=2 Tax=Microcella alkaliphila TaxID=279828 RepID=A0A0U5BBE5_9MICO|nr:uncharacterized protein MalAC0309_2230 [Microcella alkaliphila]